jgi:hypothetical protein
MPGRAVMTNSASINLVGSNANFSAISGLTTNTGSFALLQGASFTTAGALASSGTINVGPGTLTVAGNYTQGWRRTAVA